MANTQGSSRVGQSLSPDGLVEFMVPQAYWEHFRAGVVFDLASDTKNTVERYLEGYRHWAWGYPKEQRGHVDLGAEEHTGPLGFIARTADLLAAMEDACPAAGKPERDISVKGDPEAIIFGLSALAGRVAAPTLSETLTLEPAEENAKAREWLSIVEWALDAMEALEPVRRAATKQRVEESKKEKS